MIICLMGGSNAGKDRLQNIISERCNIPVCVSSTTRPMRENEVNGKTYHFISIDQFLSDLNDNKFLETRMYETAVDTWYYGLSIDSVKKYDTQITIVDQNGYFEIVEKLGKENVIGFYVYSPERTKILRALNRESRNDDKFFEEFYRRMLDDMTAFNIVKDDPNVLKIENVNLEKAVSEIVTHLKRKGILE